MSSHNKSNVVNKLPSQVGMKYESNHSSDFKVDIVAFGSDNMPASSTKSPKFGYRSKYSKENTSRKTDEDFLLIKQKIRHTDNIASNIGIRKDPSRSKSKSRLVLSGIHDQSSNGENYFASQSTDRGVNVKCSASPRGSLRKTPSSNRQSGILTSKESAGSLKKFELPLNKKIVILDQSVESDNIEFVPGKKSTSGRNIPQTTTPQKTGSQKQLQRGPANQVTTSTVSVKNNSNPSAGPVSQGVVHSTTPAPHQSHSNIKHRGVVKVDISPDRIAQPDSAKHYQPPKPINPAHSSQSYQKETNSSSTKKSVKFEPVITSTKKIVAGVQTPTNNNQTKETPVKEYIQKPIVKPISAASGKRTSADKKPKPADVCIKIEENKGGSPGSKYSNKSPSSISSPPKSAQILGKHSSADRHSYENSPQKVLQEESGRHYVLEVSREAQIAKLTDIESTKPKHSPSSSGGQQTMKSVGKKSGPNSIESHDSPRFVGHQDRIRIQTGSRSPSRGSGTGDSPVQPVARHSPSNSNANTLEVTFRQKGAIQSGKQSNTSSSSKKHSTRSIEPIVHLSDELARTNGVPKPAGKIDKPRYPDDENLPHFGVITFFDSSVPSHEDDGRYKPSIITKPTYNKDVYQYQSPTARYYSPDPE